MLRSILEVLAQALHDEGYLDLQETFIDELRAGQAGRRRCGQDEARQGLEDHGHRRGLPVAVHVESATPHEVTLCAQRFVRQRLVRLIGDNAYESNRLDAALARQGVELIAPHGRTRTRRTQDGRPLRR